MALMTSFSNPRTLKFFNKVIEYLWRWMKKAFYYRETSEVMSPPETLILEGVIV